MAPIKFIFLIHYHQPTGQLRWIYDRVYENSYRLLLDVFKKYPDVKVAIHVSGPLLLEMLERSPEYIEELVRLSENGSVELLAGSIGEAVLPLLPVEDRFYQVREYLRVFERHAGFRPRGMWLPERVWEPSLPVPLADNGIEYVFLDDTVLYRAGGWRDDALYPWLTEESGRRLGVFFIDTELRYILPWRSVGEVLAYMRSRSGDEARVLVWGSDAEKFGEWRDPGWARRWLTEFFEALRNSRDIVETVHPGEYVEQYGYRGLRYLPSGSYDKMMEWSGGFFRNFLVKYPESNNMHKKMLWVRRKLREAGPRLPEEAWRHYHLAQCNDPYWHGLFGGIYLPHLRQAVYEHYIAAERMAEEVLESYSSKKLYIHRVDQDYDGAKEVLVETPLLNIYIDPGDGGTVYELDYKEEGYEHNYMDTVTRRMEPYLENTGFRMDWYRRSSARIHLWRPWATMDDWVNNTPWMDRGDVALKKHVARIAGDGEIVLRTRGAHYSEAEGAAPLYIEKKIRVDPDEPGLTVSYLVANESERTIEALLGIEHHLAPKICRETRECGLTGYRVNGVEMPVSARWGGRARRVEIISPVSRRLVLETGRGAEIWVAPINMPARTEKGIKEIYQTLGVMPVYRISLGPGEEFREEIRLVVQRS